MRKPVEIAVVMACFNRRETTLRCLRSLKAQQTPGITFQVHLLDDASSDGTAAAVGTGFPGIRILSGDGDHFWGGGMYAAMRSAITTRYDYMLWLNDDVELYPNAIASLIDAHHRAIAEHGDGLHVVSGAVQDPATGTVTYSGFRRTSRWRPAKLARVEPVAGRLTPCDTLNGNCVLASKAVVDRVGLIDPVFVQQLGDIDYGYRVRKAGGSLWIAPDIVGVCAPNPGLPWPRGLCARLRRLLSPHGLPLRPWTTFMWRWGGVPGLALLSLSYGKALLRAPR